MTRDELEAAGFPIDADAYPRLATFVALLLEENQRLNLTAVRRPAVVWVRHVCDSLAAVPILDERRAARVLDLGTGGGVPGVVLACVRPAVHFTLLDATRKKVAAVERMAAALGLVNVEMLWERAERLGHVPAQRERHDVVTVRALAQLPVALEYAAGLVRVGGTACLFRSSRAVAAEMAAAAQVAADCRLECSDIRRYNLPGGGGERAIAVYSKTAPLRRKWPRAPAQAGRPGRV